MPSETLIGIEEKIFRKYGIKFNLSSVQYIMSFQINSNF